MPKRKENIDYFPDATDKGCVPWLYTETVYDHFFNPRNFLKPEEEKKIKFNAYGMAGSPACGDIMKFWLLIEPKTEKIKMCRWRTFGCGSAIASTSMLSEMITEKGGMNLSRAIKITPRDIIKRLGGLPSQKIHCSVLGDQALRAAVDDYYKNNQKGSKKKNHKKVVNKNKNND